MRNDFQAILNGISQARGEPMGEHPLAEQITGPWRDSVAELVHDPGYKLVGSPGKGQWAHTVWLSIFDRMITESAQHGFYLVYLIRGDGGGAYLSLNQGTEEIYQQVGGRNYLRVLEDTAARDCGLLKDEETHGLRMGPIELGGASRLTRGYESGNIFAAEYEPVLPTDDQLEDDLTRLLLLYQSLIQARDQVRDDDGSAEPGDPPPGQLEARQYRWHRRAERSQSLATNAKKFHGTRCQVPACGKDLSEIYGDLARDYIEAHHLTPFAKLEGRPTHLDPKYDFAVVCPDCHRMLHRRHPEPLSLQELSDQMSALG
jgi:5-methylcytosine-specific restriction protein A